MATSKEIKYFTKSFIDFLIVDWNSKSIDPTPLQQIEDLVKRLREEYSIEAFSTQDENFMKAFIETEYPQFLKDNNLNNANDLVNILILKKTEINEQEQEKYLDLVKNFQESQRIENLYYFGDILDGDASFKAENALKELLRDMDNKNKAEFLASISIYLEHIKDTKDGEAFINQLHTEDTHVWYAKLFDRMRKSSPLKPSFEYTLEEKKIKHNIQSSGLFDGLYYSLREDRKTGQFQVSATSSVDSSWEGDSVLRHALANSIVNNALEEFFINEANKEIGIDSEPDIDLYKERLDETTLNLIKSLLLHKTFMDHSATEKNSNRNNHMAQTILKSVNQYLEKDFDCFDSMIKDLTASPTKYIKKKIKTDEQQEKSSISKDEIKAFINGNTLFTNDSYFVNYSPSSVNLELGLKETTLWNKVIGDKESNLLTPEEFKAKAQYMALMSHNIGKGDLEADAIEYFFDEHINLRALNQRNRINNSRFENDKDFEKIIVEHFILESPENIGKNLELLDRKTSKNIESYVKHYIKGLTNDNYLSKLTSTGIDYEEDYIALLKNISSDIYMDGDLNYMIMQNLKLSESESKLVDSDIERLNMALDFGAGGSYFSKNKKLKELYVYFENKGFNGDNKKIKLEDYEQAAMEMEIKRKNKNKYDLEFPITGDFSLQNKDEPASRKSCKPPKSKK